METNWQALLDDLGLPLAVMGIAVVFLALVLVTIFITLLPKMLAALSIWFPEERQLAEASKPKTDELAGELAAVIAAAVHEALGPDHRVLRIESGGAGDANWSIEGRRQHHSSHQPRWQSNN